MSPKEQIEHLKNSLEEIENILEVAICEIAGSEASWGSGNNSGFEHPHDSILKKVPESLKPAFVAMWSCREEANGALFWVSDHLEE